MAYQPEQHQVVALTELRLSVGVSLSSKQYMPVVKDQNYETHSWFCQPSCEIMRKLHFSIIKVGIIVFPSYLKC